MRAGRMAFDNARTALGKDAGAFGAAAMKCGERPQQLPQRAETFSKRASGFPNALMLLRAQPQKANKKKEQLRAKRTTFGHDVMPMPPQSTKAPHGVAIIGNAFVL